LPEALKSDKDYLERINTVNEEAEDTINIQINKQKSNDGNAPSEKFNRTSYEINGENVKLEKS
jgi:ABC-type transporter lipoprotein component MlaA